MNKNLLFAVDTATEEVIVSESPRGSNKVNFIERLSRKDNEALYSVVLTLTAMTKSTTFDAAGFKKMDKECQILYDKYKKAQ
jgi:hypothetical protein